MSDAIPTFHQGRAVLPRPVFDEQPGYVELYWKAWELAFQNFHTPAPGSGFVSNFIDAAFNEYIFLWDTCFLTMFCKYGHPHLPGIGSLDNFYVKQHDDGEICREIHRTTGEDHPLWTNGEHRPLFSRLGKREANVVTKDIPYLTLDAMNHPIFTWAEFEHYRHTGKRDRLTRHFSTLLRYYKSLDKFLKNRHGLYVTDWASMDNSPRNDRLGCGIDICCEMVMFAEHLATVAAWINDDKAERFLSRDAEQLREKINGMMWDDRDGIYYDVDDDGKHIGVKSIAAYWALLAEVASKGQADALIEELNNPKSFNRPHRVPTLAADDEHFDPKGGYWRGAVWAPTNMMVMRGLETYEQHDLAHQIAMSHLDAVAKVYQSTGTIWENYAADAIAQGEPAKRDFVGWSGLGPILNLIEFAIGLQPDAPANKLIWRLRSTDRCGCENFTFSDVTCTLVAEAGTKSDSITAKADTPFTLELHRGQQRTIHQIIPGNSRIQLRPEPQP